MSRTFTWQALAAGEVRALLSDVGLVLESQHAGFDGAPFVDDQSRVLLAAARKPP